MQLFNRNVAHSNSVLKVAIDWKATLFLLTITILLLLQNELNILLLLLIRPFLTPSEKKPKFVQNLYFAISSSSFVDFVRSSNLF